MSTAVPGTEPQPIGPAHDDGGPAFPQHPEVQRGELGMSLRDYFAAAALTGLLASADKWHYGSAWHAVGAAFECADSMLKARQQQ